MRHHCRTFALLSLLLLLFTTPSPAAIPPEALTLRDRGLAELENEKPAEAGETFRKLVKVVPESPLGWANLAIASLRQQKTTEAVAFVERALEKAPGRADLLHVKADVLQWSGRPELALPVYREAAEKDPENPEILYSLYRQATTLPGDAGEAHADWALERLVRLRPDNLVVMLHRGQRAIGSGRASSSGDGRPSHPPRAPDPPDAGRGGTDRRGCTSARGRPSR